MKSKENQLNKLYLDIGGNGVQYQINSNDMLSFSTKNKNKKYVIQKIINLINENNIHQLSISSPGACNTKTGWIDGLSGIQDYGNFNIYEEINSQLETPILILVHNDANCSLISNMDHANVEHAIQLNIGTGIGGAIAINGNLIIGANGYAGEFGYGIKNHDKKNISQQISSNALVDRFSPKYKNAKDIFQKEQHNPIFTSWLYDVSCFLINLQYFIDPQVIFISGGVSNNPRFLELINKSIDEKMKELDGYKIRPTIFVSNIKNDGLKGARILLENHARNKNN